MSENNPEINKTAISNKPACSYKTILGCICLVFILAVFSLTELAIMVGIFMLFIFFYVAIVVLGGIYLLFLTAMKFSKFLKERKNSNLK
ncbi:hypothetical protein [Francisella sp. LA112445]|uniref:hypothetical protein n=1 Tax=Francisella sp. LA112445 TaxID=1395624 RepID=UPI001788C198|nr:hypothetical protein [Francisella sp. LA112445]QIW09579.1 hypothetical protein FIP56_02365 [Francisella sp. LA112445]